MSTTLQHKIRVLRFLAQALLLPLALFACAPKAPPIPGRFLYFPLIICETGDQFSISEYRAGMKAPSLLWTGIPCQPHSNMLGFPRSRDGRYAMLISNAPFNPSTPPYFSLLLLDLANGKSKNLPVQEYSRSESQRMKAFGTFSPDNRYFAYTVNIHDNGPDRLYLLDLTSGKSSVLFESPCAQYRWMEVGGGTSACAIIGNPLWIDETTLVFNGYAGEMPRSIEVGVDIDPNHTFVMGVDGTIQQDYTPALYIDWIYGPTVLYYEYGKSADGYQWMETSELKQGKIDPHSLDVASQFRAGQVGNVGFLEGPGISPDGQYAIQRIGGVWHLIGLRTGSDTKIRNTGVKDCYSFFWSPDQKNVMCSGASKGDAIISLEGYADRRMPYFPDLVQLVWLP